MLFNYVYYVTYRWHERVQDTDGESCTTRKRLGEVQLGVGVIVVVLVKKLHVAIVDQFGNHWNVGAVHRPSSLQHYWPAGAVQTVRIELFGHRGLVCTKFQHQIKCECVVFDNTRIGSIILSYISLFMCSGDISKNIFQKNNYKLFKNIKK